MKIFKNKRVPDYFFLFILSITTIYIWHPLTKLALQWESYTYLISKAYLPLFTDPWLSFGNFDVQSMFTGASLSRLAGANMPVYFWVEILFILIINITLYFLMKTLTKSSTTAFATSFLFAVYFFGIEFFAPNYYATFLQRIILNVPLLLVSFMFLHRFLTEKKSKYYVLSLFLFFLSIFIARFGIFLSFFILLYPVFWEAFSSFKLRSFLRAFLISLPYITIVIFFLIIHKMYGDSIGPKESIIYFITHPEKYNYVEGLIRQLVNMSSYPLVIQAIFSELNPFALIDSVSAQKLAVPTLIAYMAGIIVIWKKNKKHRALLLTIISSLIISLFLNVYLNRFDVLNSSGFNRYYYYPSFLLAIFWALFLTTLFNKKRFFILGFILVGFFLINASLFRQYFFNLDRYGLPTKELYKYIVKNYNQLPEGSFVIVGPGADFGPYEAGFFTEQVGSKRNILFKTESLGWGDWRPIASSSAHVVKLSYNKACSCVKREIVK